MTDENPVMQHTHEPGASPEEAETLVEALAGKRSLPDEVQRIVRDALINGQLVEDTVDVSLTFVAPGGQRVKFRLPPEEVGVPLSILGD